MGNILIPKSIHQIWSEKYGPLPEVLKILGQTWKNNHPEWNYIYWNEKAILSFLDDHYPNYLDKYHAFVYDIQRWDAIRYLILLHFGGVYVDYDYENLISLEPLLENVNCFFAMEPKEHISNDTPSPYFNNALMGCKPGDPFMQEIVDYVFENEHCIDGNKNDKSNYVLKSTGPVMLSTLYQSSIHKKGITLLATKNVSPFTYFESRAYLNGEENEVLDNKLNDAYAVHYFLNSWNQ